MKQKRAQYNFALIIILAALIVTPIIFIIRASFKQEAISNKFCYIYISSDSIKHVALSCNRHDAYVYRDFYLDTIAKSKAISGCGYVSRFIKVEILKYSKDSLIAKVRIVKYDPRGYPFKDTGWVPSFTLHDTLPERLRNKEKNVTINDDNFFDNLFKKSNY